MKTQENYNFNEWFASRNLNQLAYQSEKMQLIINSLATQELPTVFAATPSAGKTLMTIAIIDAIIKDNPNFRVLILPHGTVVLRRQFADEISQRNVGFTYCEVETKEDMDGCDAQVVISIPQSLIKLEELPHFDMVVVDEAHEFYLADDGMVQKLISKCGAKHKLLLTGTPSKFVKREFPLIVVSLNEIMEYDMVAPLTVVMATSKYNIRSNQFTSSGEVVDEFQFNEQDTEHTLDEFLSVLKENIMNIEGEIMQSNGNEWNGPLEQLDKTMIVCRRVEQADQVKRYFNRKGINVALSTGEHDADSTEIERFKTDDNCHVLIVVNRGILGFSFKKLVNVVDMSSMQNLDRIFQLLARVIRIHPDNRNKFFFKIVPNGLEEEYKRIMSATMCLADEEYFTKYDGDNFLGVRIPGTRPDRPEPRIDDIDEPDEDGGEEPEPAPFVPNTEWLGLPDGLNFFKDLLFQTRNKTVENYAFASILEIKMQLGEYKQAPNGYYTFEMVEESALKFNNPTKWQIAEPAICGVAIRNGWYHDVTKHMTRRTVWDTLEKCKADALNYTTKNAWRKSSQSAYNAAKKNGWFDECTAHMQIVNKPIDSWTLDECIDEAKKVSNSKEFITKAQGAYKAAKKNGWFEECKNYFKK